MTTLESIKETVKRELPHKKEQNHKREANQVERAALHEESLALGKRIDRSIGALGAGWGLRSEKAFRDALASSIDKAGMYIFERKARFYERHHQRQANRLIVISPMIDSRAQDVARQLGIETYGEPEEVSG
ncbi:hypothetical protein Thiofri_01974 [Thiorhodovibrio frisius]|nr:hypothetical protein Thiofri_01974 [Thiorhodovibrio frisius]